MDEKPEMRPMGQAIQIDETRIRDHLGEMVRGTVEEALNAMLDAEADRLCGAGRYERSEARKDTRAGSYERNLETKAGQLSLKVPKLRRQAFETAIIERYRRRKSSVEEALIEMYLAGVSVPRVEDITEALRGARVSPSTVSNVNKKIHAKIEAWRNRPIEGEQSRDAHEGEAVAQLIPGLVVRQRVERLQHQHAGHHHRVVGRAAAFGAVPAVECGSKSGRNRSKSTTADSRSGGSPAAESD